MVQAIEIFMITQQNVKQPRENYNLKCDSAVTFARKFLQK